jgi:hypothetical protein
MRAAIPLPPCKTRFKVKLRLFILALVGALVLATGAAAHQLETISRKGVNTTSRLANFDCGFRGNYVGLDDLLLFCDGPQGFAKARYDFYLPKNLYGTPTMHVYADKLCCSSSVVKKTLAHVEGHHYRIVIKVSRRTRYDVRSVSLSYYVR